MCNVSADLSGKTVIITGANTGIGLETAKALAKMNANLILACRDIKKGNEAVKNVEAFLNTTSHKNTIDFMELDLANMKSIRNFAASFNAKYSALDILINNAGVMHTPRQNTSDGFEMQIGTNHLGPFLLTRLLIEKLKSTKGAKIINLSSRAHMRGGPIELDDINWEKREYSSIQAYSHSKSASILFTIELQKRLKDTGIQVFAVHPGVVDTDLLRQWPPVVQTLGHFILPIVAKTTLEGAQTTICAAVSKSFDGFGGSYLSNCEILAAEPHATDPTYAKKLWNISSSLVGLPPD